METVTTFVSVDCSCGISFTVLRDDLWGNREMRCPGRIYGCRVVHSSEYIRLNEKKGVLVVSPSGEYKKRVDASLAAYDADRQYAQKSATRRQSSDASPLASSLKKAVAKVESYDDLPF